MHFYYLSMFMPSVYTICFLRLLVFGGRLSGVGFEVLTEGELLREAQFIRHLFDQDIRLAQEVFGLIDGHHIDPIHRGITGFRCSL